MNARSFSYRTILTGTDFTPLGDLSIGAALDTAVLLGAERVHVLHAARPLDLAGTALQLERLPSELAQQVENELRVRAQGQLARLSPFLDRALPHNLNLTREAQIGDPAEQLARCASRIGADLIVVATHGRGALGRLLLGSVTGNLIRIAPCPVLGFGEDRISPAVISRVMVAVDLSSAAPAVLARAASLASLCRAELRVLSAYEFPMRVGTSALLPVPELLRGHVLLDAGAHRSAIENLVRQAELPEELVRSIETPAGLPARTILSAAEQHDVDLIVIGTSGHNVTERALLGSTATRVLSRSSRPVMVVPLPPPSAGAS